MPDHYIPRVKLVAGTIVALPPLTVGGPPEPGYALSINGAIVTGATWNLTYIPTIGDEVKVLLVDGAAIVIGPVGIALRALEGVVASTPSAGLIAVTTSYGTLFCRFAGTAPDVGTPVRLDWSSTTPWVWGGEIAGIDPPIDSGGPQPPPPTVGSGNTVFTPIDSGSWQVGGTWNWAGNSVLQYKYGGAPENRGAWFYGNAPRQLAGTTVTAVNFRTGPRAHIGSYNSALTAHFYRHANETRPGGDVSRTAGPHNVTFAPNQGPTWISLPVAFGQQIVDGGGGIALLGSPYMGFDGVNVDPASGQLDIHWTR